MTDTQIIEFLQDNSEFFTSNSMVAGILRSIGWMLVKLFTTAIDICQTLYDTTFGLVDITKWTGLETFLEDFKPLMEAFLFGSIVLLAFMIILGKQKQNHLLTSMLVFAVVTTSSTYLFSQVNMWTITFKDAILSGNGQTNGTELVLTFSQKEQIPRLQRGETILCISGDQNIEFNVYLSSEEERLFAGGA